MAFSLSFKNFDYRTILKVFIRLSINIRFQKKKNFKELHCLPAKQTGRRPACFEHICSEFNFEWPTNQKAGF